MGIKRHMPIADQVTLLLHQRILDGVYPPGERMVSEQDLAEEFNISRGTVRSALATLASQGLIVRRQGDGTYVNEIKDNQNSFMHAIWEYARLIRASGREPMIAPLSLIKRKANKVEVDALEINEEDEIIHVERIFFADGKPIIFSQNMSPIGIFVEEMGHLDAVLGIHEFLMKYCEREIASVDVDISPVMPNDRIKEALSINDNDPVFHFEEIFRDINRTPLVYANNYYCDKKLSLHGIRPWYSVINNQSIDINGGS